MHSSHIITRIEDLIRQLNTLKMEVMAMSGNSVLGGAGSALTNSKLCNCIGTKLIPQDSGEYGQYGYHYR